jgi:hypothetical protein
MSTNIGPPGWQPHAIVSRLDGYVSVDGRVPDFIADVMAAAKTRTRNCLIAAIRARMACRERMLRRMRKFNHD